MFFTVIEVVRAQACYAAKSRGGGIFRPGIANSDSPPETN